MTGCSLSAVAPTSGRPVVTPWHAKLSNSRTFSILGISSSVFCSGLYKESSTGLEKCRGFCCGWCENRSVLFHHFPLCVVMNWYQRNVTESSCVAFVVASTRSYLLPCSFSCTLLSSTSCHSDHKYFVSCSYQQRCIYSLHCLSAFCSYSLIPHVSSFPVNLPASDFYIIFFSCPTLAQLPSDFSFVWCIFFPPFLCSVACEMHWTVALPRSIIQWERDKSIELWECTLSSVCCRGQDRLSVIQFYVV